MPHDDSMSAEKGQTARRAVRLFLCGASLLFWELVLIRWMGSCVRVVAYYSNFVLIAAFFGLGLGALLARFELPLRRVLLPLLAACILLGVALGRYGNLNPADTSETVWTGDPAGIELSQPAIQALPFWAVLAAVYVVTVAVFTVFGQWVGHLFRELPPLRAYSLEVGGSLFGILLFSLLAFFQVSPAGWVITGVTLLFLLLLLQKAAAVDYMVAAVSAVIIVLAVYGESRGFIWSPYYKIKVEPIRRIKDLATRRPFEFQRLVGYSLTVNNDYHQMMLDLGPRRAGEHSFLSNWRIMYESPYDKDADLPPGPILVVGAGTGNDVMAALRRTRREIYAVDIDPAIVSLGRRYHPESPYSDPRVKVVIDDARSFFQRTDVRFAMVVFGYLDSHTLLSSFSSLRLDNFVYTKESLEQVRRILLPGGEAVLTFCTTTPWIHERFVRLLSEVFDKPARVMFARRGSYVSGVIYRNFKMKDGAGEPAAPAVRAASVGAYPTDDWPFLYLARPQIPIHYRVFLVLVVALGFLALLALPRGQRSIKLPFFFLGTSFFLLETSNIVSLSLLFGSTWIINAFVFAGILALVLLGNLVSSCLDRRRLPLVFAGIGVTLLVAYLVPVSGLLMIRQDALRGILAVLVFLGPVFFASLAFALLIRDEKNFYQAYGSNILGAVIGGALEYFSLIMGFKFLLVLTAVFYLLAFVAWWAGSAAAGRRVGLSPPT